MTVHHDLTSEALSLDTLPARLAQLAQHKSEPVARLAIRHPALPAALWRALVLAGVPEAWDSPQALLGVLCWSPQTDGEATLLAGAKVAAAALVKEPDRCGPDGRALIARTLAPWWREETDAREMLRHLGNRAASAGQGTHAHRQVTLLACLCARTVTSEITEGADRAEGTVILDALDAWATGQAPETDLAALCSRAWALRDRLWSDAANAANAARAANAAAATTCANATARAANAAYAADADAAANAAANAAYAAAYAAYQKNLAALADLIRSALPECPL